ncbi:LPXTG cell wall anchor domain-containing protein [Leifsonia sp. PS1209]|uniref:LPXTG cell wall anchor domain-containing protein n=1 Tax=Leifsonia sp. PS1209 TaxID=2724914 RepID=UPI001B3233E8|nr:LPXTG cell wall anchor domain-containing protein [Leifsonia sp. PS1209]
MGAAVSGVVLAPAAAWAVDEQPSDQIAEAEPAPDRITHIAVSPLQALPGGLVHVTGECTLKGRAATLVGVYLNKVVFDNNYVDFALDVPIDGATGRIDADIAIPSDASPGTYRVGWMCSMFDMGFGGDDIDSEPVHFTVLDSGIPTPTPEPEPSVAVPSAPPAPSTSNSTPTSTPTSTTSEDELAATGSSSTVAAGIATMIALAGAAMLLLRRTRRTKPGA